ncbi:hypothetical protein BX666DRAFT_1981296 [Dichotomocladium elegans]|nr:hypothetical protein BX666DRAFT_1981296 [Dichotomocladium elegans]
MDCCLCNRKVYVTEKVDANGKQYHKVCFKCSERGCRLTISNFHSHEGRLFCQKHVPKLQAVISRTGTCRSNSGTRRLRHQESAQDEN